MKIRWSAEARQDLNDMVRFISDDDPPAARRLAHRIRKALSETTVFPSIGRIVPEFGNQDLRELIVPPYRVVYRVREGILVARVWHSKRELTEDTDIPRE